MDTDNVTTVGASYPTELINAIPQIVIPFATCPAERMNPIKDLLANWANAPTACHNCPIKL